MSRKTLLAALFLLLTAGAAAAYWLPQLRRDTPAPQLRPDTPAPQPLRLPTRHQFTVLQRDAVSACRCARQRDDEAGKQECWAGFEKAIAPFPTVERVSMCGFSSVERCFEDGGTEDCIAVGWSARAGRRSAICTKEEARTAEAVWGENLSKGDRAADRALEALLAKFRRGDQVAMAGPGQGCTSG